MPEVRIPGVPVIMSDVEPTIPANSGFDVTDWKWYNTTNHRWYDYEGGWQRHGEELCSVLPDIVTLLGNGITGTKTIAGYTFTFNHGVLTGFEAPE